MYTDKKNIKNDVRKNNVKKFKVKNTGSKLDDQISVIIVDDQFDFGDPNGALYKIRKICETITTLIFQYDEIPVPIGRTVHDVPQKTRIDLLQDYGIINSLLAKSRARKAAVMPVKTSPLPAEAIPLFPVVFR